MRLKRNVCGLTNIHLQYRSLLGNKWGNSGLNLA